MKSISSVDIHYLVSELQWIVGAKIDKIFMPHKLEMLLQIHIPGKGKKILRLVAGKLFYLSDFKPAQTEPTGFCTYLRKHVYGRIRVFRQLEAERIIEIIFENQVGTSSLIVELFSKGNIVLVRDGTIVNAAEQQKWKDRTIMPKYAYSYPQQGYNFRTITEDGVKNLLINTRSESIVKALALTLGVGGIYAEELCKGIDKNASPESVDSHLLYEKIQALRMATPSLNADYDALYTKETQENDQKVATLGASKRQKKYDTIISTQTATIRKLTEEIDISTKIGEAIYEHYNNLADLLRRIQIAAKTASYQEIRDALIEKKKIKNLDPKLKTVTIEL